MPPSQLLLFPDPRPLVERLGAAFFRGLPETPGVYLMRDAAGAVLYVGKALNLRRRLGSYRVANPDRLGTRHLRLLRAVAVIDVEECIDEEAALATEGRLLRSLCPRFNRAGTWAACPRFIGWRRAAEALELAALDATAPEWRLLGPARGAQRMRNALARLVWSAIHPGRSFCELPHGWLGPARVERRRIECGRRLDEVHAMLDALGDGRVAEFAQWLQAANPVPRLFDAAAITADLETIAQGLTHLRAARRCAN
jgi:predicted GIY-YIG superfamily endonuclease